MITKPTETKIRILHIITSLDADGAQNMLLKLCQNISSEHFEFKVLNLREPTAFSERFAKINVPVEHLNMRRMLPSLKALRQIATVIDSFKPDLIQGWMYHGNLAATAGRFFALHKAPVLWNIRKATDLADYRPLTRLTVKLGALLSNQAAKIIYCGEFIALQHTALGYSRTNQQTIPNGFDTSRFVPNPESYREVRARLGLAADTPLVGMTARYHPHKDHPNFLRAAAIIKKEIPAVHFILAGRGLTPENKELTTLAQSLGIDGCLHLLGECDEVAELIPAFDLYCLSSSAEGFPNSLGEAMSCEVPCVTTAVGASAEVVGEIGITVPAKDSVSLAAAAIRLLQLSQTDRQKLQKQSRERIIERFSLPVIGAEYEKAYRQSIAAAKTEYSGRTKLASNVVR